MTDLDQRPFFRLDALDECLWRLKADGAEERVALRPKAFQLLCYLNDNPGRLLTHDELLDGVWRDAPVQPEVLKSHILSIRTALGDSRDRPAFIETVRGRGYRFIGAVKLAAAPKVGEGDTDRFVGRIDPIERLLSALDLSLSQSARLVMVSGEPGIGKTTLIRQFLKRAAADRNFLAGVGQCVEGFGAVEPYYPLLDLLGRLCDGASGSRVVRALLDAAPGWAAQMPSRIPIRGRLPAPDAAVSSGRMLREGCELFEMLAAEVPLVLVLEDLHWADCATVDFLSALGRRNSGSKLLVVGTCRPDKLAAGRSSLRDVLHEHVLHGRIEEIQLGPLSKYDVGSYLAGGERAKPDSERFAARLREHSGGNPLFLKAILEHLTERGQIRPSGRGWALDEGSEKIAFDVPPTVERLIDYQVTRLPEATRRLLETASVTGMQFTAEVAAGAAGLDADDFDAVCDDLARDHCFVQRGEAQRLADGSPGQSYLFSHALYRRVLYDRQAPARRAKLHRAIGERLEQLHPQDSRDAVCTDLAHHFAAGADWDKALFYLRAALRVASRRAARQDALQIIELADSCVAHLPDRLRGAAELEFLERRAALLAATHDPEAEKALERLARKAVERGDIDTEVRALLNLAHVSSWRDVEASLAALDRVLGLASHQEDGAARALTLVTAHARRIWSAGMNDGDALACEAAIGTLRAGTNRQAKARGLVSFSMVLLLSGRYREAHDSFMEGYLVLAEAPGGLAESELARILWMYHVGVPWTLLSMGRLGDALAALDGSIAAYERNGERQAVLSLQIYRALSLFHAGDFCGVLKACHGVASGDYAKTAGAARLLPVERRMSLILCGLAEVAEGRVKAGVVHLLAAKREMERQQVHLDWYWRLLLEWGLVNAAIAEGGGAAALATSERLIELALVAAEPTWLALAWEAHARASLAVGRIDNAFAHLEKAIGLLRGGAAPLAEWRVLRTKAILETASGNAGQAIRSAQSARMAADRLAETLPEGHKGRDLLADLCEAD